MPCIWGQHNNSQLFIPVAVIDALKVNVASVLGPPTTSIPKLYQALVDTGAQRTMVSASLAIAEQLNPIGKMPLRGIGPTPTWHTAYLFHVAFIFGFAPGGLTPSGPYQATLHTLSTPIHGAEIASGGGFDVLLGMDVISTGSLKVEGNQTFSWSF